MDSELSSRMDRLEDMMAQLLRTCATKAAIAELRKDNQEMRSEINMIKVEIRELRAEMYDIRDELRTEMHDIRDELRAEMHGMRDELRTEMHGIRDELRQEIQAVAETVAGIDKRFDCLVEEVGKQHARLSMRVAVLEQAD